MWLLKSGGGGSGPGGGRGAAPPALDVPGNAGKSSDDIVNSDCSDVGCFTIPTVKITRSNYTLVNYFIETMPTTRIVM